MNAANVRIKEIRWSCRKSLIQELESHELIVVKVTKVTI